MPSSNDVCCIRGCTRVSRQKRGNVLPVKFYRFPLSQFNEPWKNDKRLKWIKAVKNYVKYPKEWVPNKNTKICSAHFLNNKKSEHPLHPSYIPSIFPGKNNAKQWIQSMRRFDLWTQKYQLSKDIDNKELKEGEKKIIINSNNTCDPDPLKCDLDRNDPKEIIDDDGDGDDDDDDNYLLIVAPEQVSISCQTEEVKDNTFDNCTYLFCNLDYREGISTAAVQTNIAIKKPMRKIFRVDMPVVKKPTVKDFGCDPINEVILKSPCHGFHGFSSITNDEYLSSLTGVTFAIFTFIFNLLPECKSSKTDKRNKLLITLMKLKTGLTFPALAVLFNIHRSSARRIFIQNLQQLNILLQKFVFWPSKDTVKATLPVTFRRHFSETRVIINCIEVNTEVPQEITQKLLKYSEYKQKHMAVKFIVGCTPKGFVCFVSKCYGGCSGNPNASDCGIVDIIEPGDVVLADKDLPHIQTEIEKKDAMFVVPLIYYNDQFSNEQIEEYNVALQIKRLKQRIKDFNILSNLPMALLPHIDEIVFVVCALMNIEKPSNIN